MSNALSSIIKCAAFLFSYDLLTVLNTVLDDRAQCFWEFGCSKIRQFSCHLMICPRTLCVYYFWMTTPNNHTRLLGILILIPLCSTPFAMALDASHIKADFLCGKFRHLCRSKRLLPRNRLILVSTISLSNDEVKKIVHGCWNRKHLYW